MTVFTPYVTEIPIVAVEGEIDPTAVAALRRRVTVALDVGRGFVVLDLRAVTVLAGQAVRMFCEALEVAQRTGARLAITGAQPALRGLLERWAIVGVELYPTLTAAVGAAGSPHRAAPAIALGPDALAASAFSRFSP